MKKWAWIVCCLFACISVHAQSAWKIFPKEAEVLSKKLRNTFTTRIYNDELQIEQVNVVNNRMLQLQLRCPLYGLEYRSDISVAKRSKKYSNYKEFAIFKPEEPLYFLPDESIRIGVDLSMFEDGEYCFLIKLYTAFEEIYFVRVYLNTEKFPDHGTIVEMMPTETYDYEEEQADEDYVYSFIEDHADFPGGKEALHRFIKENIKWENLPSDLRIPYEYVWVGMIIDKDGSILYPEILNTSHKGMNDEVMRIVSIMPKWKPATIRGKKVKYREIVTIRPKH